MFFIKNSIHNPNNYKKKKINDIFSSKNVVAVKERTKLSKLKAFIGFLLVSAFIGIIASISGLLIFSVSSIIFSPAKGIWDSIPKDLEEISISQRNILYDKDGKVFAEIWDENRVNLKSLDEINQYAVKALINTEDKNFYENSGYDLKAIFRSAALGSGGGSGITQQLVKNLQFYNQAGTTDKESSVENSLTRKLKELKLSIEYDSIHSKDEILLSYFNTVAFGAPNIYSIEAASNYFFDKHAKDLTLAESAALVGTVQNPTIYDMTDPENVDWKNRQYDVLERMFSENTITQKEFDEAFSQELDFKYKKSGGNCLSSEFPFYCEYTINFLKNDPKLGESPEERNAILSKGGLKINTFLDRKALENAESTLKESFGIHNRIVSPVAIVQPGTGGVEAIAVNRDFGSGDGETEIIVPNNPTGTGSVYKMITLAAALDNGMTEKDLSFSSRCPLIDPNYDTPEDGVTNSVSCNFQGGFMDYKKATALSSNTWFTELEIKIGVEKVKELSSNLGLSAPDSITERSLSYTLGVTENSPIDMAAAFATFANEGIYCPATPIKNYTYMDDSILTVPDNYDPSETSCKRVLSPYSSSVVLKAMRANVSGEIKDSFGLGRIVPNQDTVGKSGTNELFNSAWVDISSNYSLFINVYDMNKLTDTMDYIEYKGETVRWFDNAAEDAGNEIFNKILKDQPASVLNFDSNNINKDSVEIDERDFFSVPSVLGMKPDEAVSVFQKIGMNVKVSKILKNSLPGYSSGVIVEQDIEPGTKLAIGTKKTIILNISK